MAAQHHAVGGRRGLPDQPRSGCGRPCPKSEAVRAKCDLMEQSIVTGKHGWRFMVVSLPDECSSVVVAGGDPLTIGTVRDVIHRGLSQPLVDLLPAGQVPLADGIV